jgi:hypothetical protein
MGLLRPSDKARLDRAWQRFIQLKRQRIEADRQFSEACSLEAEERRAHANVGFVRHDLGLDE